MKILTLKANLGKNEPEVTLLERRRVEKKLFLFPFFDLFLKKNLTSGMQIYAAHLMKEKRSRKNLKITIISNRF